MPGSFLFGIVGAVPCGPRIIVAMDEIYKKFSMVYDRIHTPNKYWGLIDEIFAGKNKIGTKPRVLDLGCGTGSFLAGMHERGWEITGLDISSGMLERAGQKFKAAGIPCVLCQKDMADFHIEGEFELVTSNFDSVNYVMDIEGIERLFKNVHAILRENGVFAFDVVTKYQAQNYVNPFKKEFEDVRLEMVPHYDQTSNIKRLEIDIVSGADRAKEVHEQKMYDLGDIGLNLKAAGFSEYKMMSIEGKTREIMDSSTRVYFVAVK